MKKDNTKIEKVQEFESAINDGRLTSGEINTENQEAVNEKLITELTLELEKMQQILDSKKYIVEGKKEIANDLLQFIKDNAKWRFTEALGIIEVAKMLTAFIEDNKQKELMLGPLEVEALYYFMSKHEGVGINEAQHFVKMLKAINPAKGHKEQDSKRYEDLSFRLNSVKHGVDPLDKISE